MRRVVDAEGEASVGAEVALYELRSLVLWYFAGLIKERRIVKYNGLRASRNETGHEGDDVVWGPAQKCFLQRLPVSARLVCQLRRFLYDKLI